MLTKIRKHKKLLALVLTVAIALAAYRFYSSRKDNDSRISQIERGTVTEDLILTGVVDATEYARLPFLSSGEVSEVLVGVGNVVKRGQVLMRLDAGVAYQQFLQSESNLRSAQATLNRVYDGLQGREDDETFAQIELRTSSEVSKDNAYRNYMIAQKNLANLVLRSPFDGIIARIENPFSGINTNFSQSQIEVVNPSTIYFKALADQNEISQIFLGQIATVSLDTIEKDLNGRVSFVGLVPEPGEIGIVYPVFVEFDSIDEIKNLVKIGMSGDVRFELNRKENVLYVEPQFIQRKNGDNYLLIGRNKKRVNIEVGLEGETRVEISGNLNEGTEIFDR